MSFRPEDLVPDTYIADARLDTWQPNQFHGAQYNGTNRNGSFEHTGEGAARTHELLLTFGADADSMSDLADLVDYPIVLRQDPSYVMSIPFIGFHVPATFAGPDPDIGVVEQRLEDAGRQMFLRRHESLDYGFWRYGSLHWNPPTSEADDRGSYRTFDGTQYGLQTIPWLLFLRGGPREFYDEAVVSARFAMDVATNHYTTRRYLKDDLDQQSSVPQPAGFAADARLFMFPWQVSRGTMINKKPKLTYLLACFHLTGYDRARETAQLQILGALEQFDRLAPSDPTPPNLHQALLASGTGMVGGHRERLNTILFWAEAANEIGDPQLWGNDYANSSHPRLGNIAGHWWDMVLDRAQGYFMEATGARIHMFDGFGAQRELRHSTLTTDPVVVVDNALVATGFDLTDGGIYDPEYTVGAMWGAESGDTSKDAVLWDIAQGTADMVAQYSPGALPAGPNQVIRGSELLRQFVFPILSGLGAAHRIRDASTTPPTGSAAVVQSDTFISVGDPNNAGPQEAYAYVECATAGTLALTLLIGIVSSINGDLPGRTITTHRYTGPSWSAIAAATNTVGTTGTGLYRDSFERVDVLVQGVAVGDVVRVTLSVPSLGGIEQHARWHVNAGGHRVVHRITHRRTALGSLTVVKHRCARIYLKPLGDDTPVAFASINASPFTVRDAESWQILGNSTLGSPTVPLATAAASSNLLAVITSSDNTNFDWGTSQMDQLGTVAGIHPYLATTPDRWFIPPA